MPYLEPTAAGRSTQWAKQTAHRLDCVVAVGYPEVSNPKSEQTIPTALRNPSREVEPNDSVKRFNALVAVDAGGEIVAHHRKSFLYYTDETWASEGPGFFSGQLPVALTKKDWSDETAGTNSAIGICMDINPYKFTAPWNEYEFAHHIMSSNAELVILSMAWLSSDMKPEDFACVSDEAGRQPDLGTISYWVERLRPVVEGEREVVCVMANRAGVEGAACYQGTSLVMKVGEGDVRIWEYLGKKTEGLLVVDTDLVSRTSLSTTHSIFCMCRSAGFVFPCFAAE